VRAFDLATGAAIRVKHCDDQAPAEIRLGQVPVEALREAAWMLLMLPAIGEVYPEGLDVPMPSGMSRPRSPLEERSSLPGLPSMCQMAMSSADTRLRWRLQTAGAVLDGDELIWPSNRDDAAGAHALSLLDTAEAGFVPGCPKVKVPGGLLDDGPPRAVRADPDRLLAQPALAGGWSRALAAVAGCGTGRR
jgi:hypothetical protein